MKKMWCWLLLLLLPALALGEVIPPEGESADYRTFTGIAARRAVVLCDSLTVRDNPGGNPVDTLRRGDTFMTWEQLDGYVNAGYADGSKQGWVRMEYVAVDPAYYVTEGETPAYAWGDSEQALRVGLLDKGEKLPILHETQDYYVVALRGASAWIKKEAPASQTFDFSVFEGLLSATIKCKDRDGKESVHSLLGSRQELSQLLVDSAPVGFATKCPFGYRTLSVTCRDGSVYNLDMAADSCCVFILDGVYYEYDASALEHDNSVLFDLFGVTGL